MTPLQVLLLLRQRARRLSAFTDATAVELSPLLHEPTTPKLRVEFWRNFGLCYKPREEANQ